MVSQGNSTLFHKPRLCCAAYGKRMGRNYTVYKIPQAFTGQQKWLCQKERFSEMMGAGMNGPSKIYVWYAS